MGVMTRLLRPNGTGERMWPASSKPGAMMGSAKVRHALPCSWASHCSEPSRHKFGCAQMVARAGRKCASIPRRCGLVRCCDRSANASAKSSLVRRVRRAATGWPIGCPRCHAHSQLAHETRCCHFHPCRSTIWRCWRRILGACSVGRRSQILLERRCPSC